MQAESIKDNISSLNYNSISPIVIVRKSRKSLYLAALVAAAGGFVVGFDSGSISGVLAMELFAQRFLNVDSTYRQGLLVAMMLFTATLGGLMSGYTCDWYSRKYTIMLGTVLFAFGALLEVIGLNFGMLIAGRLFIGFGEGFLTNAIPLYHSEIAPPDIRGRLISFYSSMASVGTIVGYFINFGTSYIANDWCWRTTFLIQVVICIFLMFTYFLPFSPRWLIDKQRKEEALDVLAHLHGSTRDDPIVLAEFNTIVTEMEFEQSFGKRTYSELFRGTNLKRTLLALFAGNGAAFTGTDAISYYAPQIFKQAGLSDTSLAIATTGSSNILSLLCNLVTLWSIDKIGRRSFFMSGAIIMGLSMFIVGGLFQSMYTVDLDGNVGLGTPGARNAAIAFIFIFSAAYSYSWGPVAYVYPAEILNMRTRAKGLALAYGLNWAVGIFMTFVMPIFMDNTVYGGYYFFGGCCTLLAIGTWFIPETKGYSLEEIDKIFNPK
ncbi:general substrate transporter [Spinellus fusiger]|nr:general substrate transporter [Spinellus fusiger]